MKVLHVLNELMPSGAETMLRLAAQPWREAGLQLEVLSVGEHPGPYASTLGEAGFRVHHLPLLPVKAFVPAYTRLLRVGAYDVVHVHPERANFALALMARVVGRAGVVRTIHNVFRFEGRLRAERRIQRALLRKVGVVQVAVGESVAEMERSNFSNPAGVVRNTFDESRFRPATPDERARARAALSIGPSEFVAVVVGNCSPVKNHQALIEALALPAAPEARILHVGLEDEEATQERELVERLGMGDRVDFLGFIDDVPALLSAADCFVMPSLYEGLSIAALETLACGVPSVLADVPGLRDLRPHVPDAWWVAPRSEPIAQALADVAAMSEADRLRWSNTTAATLKREFGVQRHVAAYLALYRDVLRSSDVANVGGGDVETR